MVRKLLRAIAAIVTVISLSTFSIHAFARSAGFELTGLALHQETGRDIYLGGLYLEAEATSSALLESPSTPKLMEYRVVARRTSMRSLLGGMLLQSEVATGETPDTDTTKFAGQILAAVKGSLYAGDSFEIVLDGRGATTAKLNGHQLGRVENADVANYFVQGWIGERGPSTTFRDSILAGNIDPRLRDMRNTHQFSETRGKEIAAWLPPPAATTPDTDSATPDVKTATAVAVASSSPLTVTRDDAATSIVQDPGAEPSAAPAQVMESPLEEPVQLASLVPLTSLINDTETVQTFDIKEYSRRVSDFHKQLVSMVYGEIKYPRRAVRRELQGRLELDITLTENGELVQVAVVQSSGHDMLDEAAVTAARTALGKEQLAAVDPMAAAEFRSENSEHELVVPVPIMFMLTQ